jgi:hypothetical protein
MEWDCFSEMKDCMDDGGIDRGDLNRNASCAAADVNVQLVIGLYLWLNT